MNETWKYAAQMRGCITHISNISHKRIQNRNKLINQKRDLLTMYHKWFENPNEQKNRYKTYW